MTLALGARLGPYEIAGPLGKGGMGEVYRARDARLGRDVAIKVLPAATAADAGALARFEYEARAVASLNHPNILALYDVGNDGGVSYAVTELLQGETLRDRLARDGALPPRRALDLAVQFARGLAAAHGRGIVHRDLKPENLFLTADGRLKILDFGLARPDASAAAHEAETRVVTEAGVLLGSAAYMAPEQIRGEPASVRSDVFSYGLVLREALTGSNPFRRGTTPDTLAAILRDDPDPLPAIPGLPPAAAALVDRCLARRPEERPASVGDLAIVLEALASTAVPPGGGGPAFPARRIAWRAVMGAAALVILLSLVLAAYVGWSAERATAGAVSADLSRADMLVRRAQQDRLERLQLHAQVVASLPTLKALFETDAPTVRDFLQSYQQRTPGAPLLIALGLGGQLVAGTGVDMLPDQGQQWLAGLAAGGGAALIAIAGVPYHAAMAHAEAGGTIFGSVVAAAPLDDGFAQVLRDVVEAETVLLGEGGVAGTSLRAAQVPWKSIAEFRDAGGLADTPVDVAVGATRYQAWGVALSDAPPAAAVVLASRDEAAGHYRGIQAGMLVLGVAVAAAILVAGWLYVRRTLPPDQRSL